jgi:eukaryotic-like serine/threonine-protein kinase
VMHPPRPIRNAQPLESGVLEADRWRQVERVLDAALARDRSEWATLLDDTCSQDPELRREVETLLDRLDAAAGFLESPPTALAAAVVAEAREEEARQERGRRVGAWRLLEEIGRGGMGRVFLAERADGEFEQRVAVKLLRPGLDTELDRARFRSERQILASLSHPNISRLLDGGVTDDGQPYLVMEYVEGQPIDRHCEERAAPLSERIELFLTVCDATQHAHRSLVVHRDLKPSNILVAGDGAVKLLDFGLAKLLEPQPDTESARTQTVQRWITPEFAAPERVRGEPATTLTDVYQLGALLYRLLAGHAPFAGRTQMADLQAAVLRLDPQPPSVRVADAAFARALRGDLDAIVMKALRKEPAERYASAHELAEDLRRWQRGEPVIARRQTLPYLARRFIRRHRAAIAAAALFVILLGAYAATVTVQRERIRSALAAATVGAERAEQVTAFMLGLFEAAEGGRVLTDSVTARELLSRGVAQARGATGQPAVQAQMFDVVGRLYTLLGEYERAVPLLEEALALRAGLHGQRSGDYLVSLENLAEASEKVGSPTDVLERRRLILELRREISGVNDGRTLAALHAFGVALHRVGETAAADSVFDAWIAAVEREPMEVSAVGARQLIDAATLKELRGDPSGAEPLLRQALDIRRSLHGDRHPAVAAGLIELAALLDRTGRREEAEPLLREAALQLRAVYPDGNPELASALRQWGNTLGGLRRFQEAQGAHREAVDLTRRFVGANTLDHAVAQLDLAFSLTMDGGFAEAAELAADARRILTDLFGRDNAMTVFAGVSLGDALRGLARYAEAETLLVAGYRRFEKPNPVTARWHGYSLGALIRLYDAQGRTAEAAPLRTRLLSASGAIPAPDTGVGSRGDGHR